MCIYAQYSSARSKIRTIFSYVCTRVEESVCTLYYTTWRKLSGVKRHFVGETSLGYSIFRNHSVLRIQSTVYEYFNCGIPTHTNVPCLMCVGSNCSTIFSNIFAQIRKNLIYVS